MNIRAFLTVLLAGFFFGSSLIASRFGVGQFNAFVFVGLRFTIAGVCFLSVYLLFQRRHPWPKDTRLWLQAATMGLIGTGIPTAAIVGSLLFQSSGVTSILVTTGPALTVVLAHFFLPGEVLTWRKVFGVLLALSGALLVTIRGETGLPDVTEANPLGYGLVVLALLCFSGMTIYTRKYMRTYDSFDVTSIQVFASALVIMPLVTVFIGLDFTNVTWLGYTALAYAGIVSTFFGFILFFAIVRNYGATTAAMTNYVVPVAASLGGILLLNEQFTVGMLAGMGLTLIGIALINYRPLSEQAAEIKQPVKVDY